MLRLHVPGWFPCLHEEDLMIMDKDFKSLWKPGWDRSVTP